MVTPAMIGVFALCLVRGFVGVWCGRVVVVGGKAGRETHPLREADSEGFTARRGWVGAVAEDGDVCGSVMV